MSESSVQAQSPLAAAAGFGPSHEDYKLSDELARLCLPQAYKDSYRNLAWVNSICALFLIVGLVGLKPPRVIHKPLSEISEPVPVVFTQPEEQPKPEIQEKPDEEQPQDTPTDAPQVVTVVAVANSPSVAFAVPVQGAVQIAQEARFATPPPLHEQAAPKPMQFNPGNAGGGVYPDPKYPPEALRNHYQGTVVIEFVVDESGKLAALPKVQKSSGFPVLDEEALETIKHRWRFAPGKPGYFYKPFTFQLQ